MPTTPPFPSLFIGPSDDPRHKAEKGQVQLHGLVTLLSVTVSPACNSTPPKKAETRSHEYIQLHHSVISLTDLGRILWGIYIGQGVLGGSPWLLEVGTWWERHRTQLWRCIWRAQGPEDPSSYLGCLDGYLRGRRES